MDTNEQSDFRLITESLKVSRDLKNVIDTAYNDGKQQGIKEVTKEIRERNMAQGRLEEKTRNIKTALIRNRLSLEEIVEDFDTTIEFVTQIKQRYNL